MVELDRRAYLGALTTALAGGATTGVQSAAAEDDIATSDETQAGHEATGPAGPWSQYQVGPANTGSTATQGPRGNLEVDWEYTDVEYSGVRSGPAVVDGTLYFTSMASDLSEDGRVHAVDAADGSELWQVDTGWRDQATPAVADGRVFVGDGELLALDAESGEELWTGDEEVYGSVTVAGDAVYAAVYDGVVRAFDAATGDVEWTFDPARDGTDWSTVSTPAVVDGTVYATADAQQGDGYQAVAYALDAETGEIQWFGGLPPSANAGLDAGPAVADGTVFVTLGGTLSALDAATGEVQWSTASTVRPTVWDGTVFAVEEPGSLTGDDSVAVLALDAETGETQWRFVPDADDVEGPTDLVVASGTLYFGTFDRGAFVLDAATGQQRDRVLHDQAATIRATPTVADGTLYLPTSGSSPAVYAFVDGCTPPPEV